MAKPSHHTGQSAEPSRWRRVFVGFAVGLLVLQFRKLLIGPTPEVGSQPGAPGPTPDRPENPRTAFEPTDWKLRYVAVVYAGTLMLLVVSVLVLMAAYPGALPDADRTLNIAPPGPRLQTNPQADLQQFGAEERKLLHSYYWTDKDKGLLHVPIEQTMEKLAQTGIDGFPKAQR